ncbi:MAG: META domain-containing protein [Marinilabiliaceae bacterium]|nr:META domain-containing protein [Marinilabiliaceae bacterium]
MKTLFIALIAFPLLISCKSTQNTSNNSSNEQMRTQKASEVFIETNKWELTRFNEQSPAEAGFADRTPNLVINMQESKIGGFSGCNSFGGKVAIEENKITFNQVFSTKMFCEGIPEPEFFKLLNNTLTYSIANNTLTFKKDSKVVMEFKLVSE